jgi:hypothetical protein
LSLKTYSKTSDYDENKEILKVILKTLNSKKIIKYTMIPNKNENDNNGDSDNSED